MADYFGNDAQNAVVGAVYANVAVGFCKRSALFDFVDGGQQIGFFEAGIELLFLERFLDLGWWKVKVYC